MFRVIVGFSQQERCDLIRNLIIGYGYLDVVTCNSGAEILRHAQPGGEGIIICGMKLRDMQYSHVYESLPEGYGLLVLLSRNQGDLFSDDEVLSLALPVNKQDLLRTVNMVYELGRKESTSRLQEKGEGKSVVGNTADRFLIERAKLYLMNHHRLTEAAAHRMIQKKSMTMGLKMVDTARMILKEK